MAIFFNGLAMRVLRLGALIILLAATLYGTHPALAQTTKNLKMMRIGTLDTYLPDQFVDLDPRSVHSALSQSIINAMYVGLTRMERPRSGSPERAVLALAETHTQDVADPRIHYFTIRADAKFNDGTPITAETFAKTLGGSSRTSFASRLLDHAREEDGKLRLTFTRPVGIEEAAMLVSQPYYFPLDLRNTTLVNFRPISATGNGPFRLDSLSDDLVVLVRDPRYTDTKIIPSTNINRIEIQLYRFSVALGEAIKTGEIDIAYNWTMGSYDTGLTASGIQTIIYPTQSIFYLTFGLDQSPFGTAEARRGLSYFVDHKPLFANQRPLLSIIPSALYKTPISALFSLGDSVEGVRVLKAAGFTERQPLQADLIYPKESPEGFYTATVKSLMAKFGTTKALTITPRALEFLDHFDKVRQGEFQVTVNADTVRVGNVDSTLYDFGSSQGEFAKFARYSNPQIDTLLLQLATSSGAQANTIRNQILTILRDDAPYIPLWEVDQTLYTRPDVRAIVVNPEATIDLPLLARQE